MTTQIHPTFQNLYDQDYVLWLETTIDQLRQEKFSSVDWENLLDELESMGKSEKRSLLSLLTRLLEHLLKLAYWDSEREYNVNKWKSKITTFRNQIQKLLKDSPSLKPYLQEIFPECYSDARESMSLLISLEIPFDKIATLEQVLDKSWFPLTRDLDNV